MTTEQRDGPMEVLALGVGRTGTDSLREALKTLGYDDCYHGYSLIHENPTDAYLWNKAMDAKFLGKGKPYGREEWDRLLGGCRAVSDLPCVLFYEELINTYPDAKVILTTPPMGFDRWYESNLATLMPVRNDWTWDVWCLFCTEMRITRWTFWRAFDHFWTRDFPAHAKLIYETHNARIKRLVPEKQLLEYSVAQGWRPLCQFLEKPMPEVEYPEGNNRPEFFERINLVGKRRRRTAILNLSCTVLGVATTLGIIAYRARAFGLGRR